MLASGAAAIERAWRAGAPAGGVGEFDLIARLDRWSRAGQVRAGQVRAGHVRAGRVSAGRGPGRRGEVVAGIGDDAALLRAPAGWDLVLTCDAQIEGQHFERRWLTPRELGARAAEVNLSDLAAMGALPVAALVSLGVPPDLPLPALRGIYRGLARALAAQGAVIAGGNVSAAEQLILDLTLAGRVERGRALRRSGARPGDLVCVTGHPGRAAAALAGLERPAGGPAAPLPPALRAALVAPRARVAVGRFLVENRLATAAVDQSDGLGGDLARLCEASGAGIVIDAAALPVHRSVRAAARRRGVDPLAWVTGPSDDYELLFTVPRRKIDLALALPPAFGVPVALVGVVVAGRPRVRIWRDGALAPVAAGWDHLRPGR
ncbi:MAG: thiamine-phosphate kinase [Candidatus Eisenbacteria bacterium]|uniref:Thiamine-monophosphate kinase n=1 Tax=Eiseniibacteriota bacterium TaxID=2212470 RepID=A0A937XCJ7_UNCEI|nr:thiamine-phosphate kinase [Candidatus Eisenbacteria bacterium]